MTEPPTEPDSSATPDHRGPVESSAAAADRGARCGPPVPHGPSPRSLWGWRALLLIPAGIGVVGVYGHLSAPADTVRLTLVAIAGTALLVLLRLGWWGAGQPELTQLEANRVHSELGREDRRLLQRALRRGDDVPTELRPWVPAYLALDPAGPAHTSTFWLPVMSANLLLFTARADSPSTADIVLTGTLVVLMAMIVVVIAVARRMRRHARRFTTTTVDAARRG